MTTPLADLPKQGTRGSGVSASAAWRLPSASTNLTTIRQRRLRAPANCRRMLEADGFDIVGEAANGAAALNAVEVLLPGIVLLGIQLPGIDGITWRKGL